MSLMAGLSTDFTLALFLLFAGIGFGDIGRRRLAGIGRVL
jgi:hypothetical protein